MTPEVNLITTLVAALGVAIVTGFIAARLKLPPLVGYLVAGVLIGPHTGGFATDVELAGQLAEIGVMLLMFGVGLHFSLEDLASVRGIALPAAVVQMASVTTIGTTIAWWSGWPFGASLLFSIALSVASTVVLLRALETRGALHTFNGKLATGWLIMQDLVMLLVLVLLPPLAGATSSTEAAARTIVTTLAITFVKVAAFGVLMFVVGRRVFPRILWLVAKTGSRELFTLCVIAAAVGVAYGAAALFGVSFALGAFFAGMMMRESELSHRAADESLPLRDAFAVLFFVSVGMLFDPGVVLREPLVLLVVLAVIIIGNGAVSVALVLLFRYPLNTALVVGVSLAQIGEFSFILAKLGVQHGVLSEEAQNLILGGALLSIAINPLLFAAIGPAQRWIRSRSELARKLELRADPLAVLPDSVDQALLTGQVVIVGYGRVGRRIAEALSSRGIPYVIAEQNRGIVEQLREKDVKAVSGDASEAAVLIQAHVARASILVVATPDTINVRKIVETARLLNPKIDIVIRTHSDQEAELLREEKAGEVFMGEHELARAMTRHVLERVGGRAKPLVDPADQRRR